MYQLINVPQTDICSGSGGLSGTPAGSVVMGALTNWPLFTVLGDTYLQKHLLGNIAVFFFSLVEMYCNNLLP